jgi:hypothetical protein
MPSWHSLEKAEDFRDFVRPFIPASISTGSITLGRWATDRVTTGAATLPSAAACSVRAVAKLRFIMPPRKPLPDLGGVDLVELQLEILAVLEEQYGLTHMRRMPFSALLDYAGGARLVLVQALARIQQRQFDR